MKWFAFRSDDPRLAGYTFSGQSPEKALANARAGIADLARKNNLIPIITVKESNDSNPK